MIKVELNDKIKLTESALLDALNKLTTTNVQSFNIQSTLSMTKGLLKNWGVLVKSLASSKVVSCNLAYNELGPERIAELSEALKQNTSLTELNLTRNKLSNQGLSSIIGLLEHNRTLKTLNLKENGFNDFVLFQKLLEVVKEKNAIIQEVSIQESNFKLPDEYTKQLREALNRNKGIQSSIKAANQNVSSDPLTSQSPASASNEAIINTVSNLTIENTNLKVKITQLEEQQKSYQMDIFTLKSTVTNLELQCSTLEKKLQSMEEMNNSKKVAPTEKSFKGYEISIHDIKSSSPLIKYHIKTVLKNAGREYGSYWCIGDGNFSSVCLVEWKKQLVAMKRINIKDYDKAKQTREIFEQEVTLLLKLNSPNIIFCYGGGFVENSMFLIMELMESDLLNKIKSKSSVSCLQTNWTGAGKDYALQIVSALVYLHSQGIVHRDLKSANCLVKGDTVKLSDFGISKEVSNENTKMDNKTIITSSPEFLMGKPVSFSTDIFSLGMILWEMAEWVPVWSRHPKVDPGIEIINNRTAQYHPVKLSHEDDQDVDKAAFSSLLSSCWSMDPSARPTAEEVFDTIFSLTFPPNE